MNSFFISVRDICISKGQNPSIGTEFEKMLSKYSNIKIIQSDDRSCDMSKYWSKVRGNIS
jgi:hypothetical protein